MKAYYVRFLFNPITNEYGIDVLARTKEEAYDKAVYELIPEKYGTHPYAAWVESVTYQNGNCHRFNTFAGKPF